MKLRKIYNIILEDKIISTNFSLKNILAELKEIRKTEPKAYIQECFV